MKAVVRYFPLLACVFLIAGLCAYWIEGYTPLKSSYEIEIDVPNGVAPSTLMTHLEESDSRIVFPPVRWVYGLFARWHYRNRPLQAGTYTIRPDESFRDWLIKFQRGLPKLYSITIPEGLTTFEVGERLAEQGLVDDVETFLSLAKSPSFLVSQGLVTSSAEGYLFPSTYLFPKRYPAHKILSKMISMFHESIAQMDTTVRHAYMGSLHDYMTLASIVEKETGVAYERSIIAGVFHNRLRVKMKLQSDPTTIYGLGKFGKRLSSDDLRSDTPYNTYVISGLPPGPICNPGIDAIKAVFDPKMHNYLFFVSKNDGSHVFSETHEEHERFVDIYQRKKTNSL